MSPYVHNIDQATLKILLYGTETNANAFLPSLQHYQAALGSVAY